MSIEEIKSTLKRIEESLQAGSVMPWKYLEELQEQTAQVIYNVGHVNAMVLSGLSPNDKLSDGSGQ